MFMKKVIFPLAFSVLLGSTTQHALCMKEALQEEVETTETLLTKFKKLKNEYELEGEKNNELKIKFIENCNLTNRASSTDGILTIYPLPQPGTDDDLIASDNKLFRLSSEKEKIEEKLKIKLSEVEKKHEEEVQINIKLSTFLPEKSKGIDTQSKLIGFKDRLSLSNDRLNTFASETDKLKKALDIK
jgi:hypothetical protein